MENRVWNFEIIRWCIQLQLYCAVDVIKEISYFQINLNRIRDSATGFEYPILDPVLETRSQKKILVPGSGFGSGYAVSKLESSTQVFNRICVLGSGTEFEYPILDPVPETRIQNNILVPGSGFGSGYVVSELESSTRIRVFEFMVEGTWLSGASTKSKTGTRS